MKNEQTCMGPIRMQRFACTPKKFFLIHFRGGGFDVAEGGGANLLPDTLHIYTHDKTGLIAEYARECVVGWREISEERVPYWTTKLLSQERILHVVPLEDLEQEEREAPTRMVVCGTAGLYRYPTTQGTPKPIPILTTGDLVTRLYMSGDWTLVMTDVTREVGWVFSEALNYYEGDPEEE